MHERSTARTQQLRLRWYEWYRTVVQCTSENHSCPCEGEQIRLDLLVAGVAASAEAKNSAVELLKIADQIRANAAARSFFANRVRNYLQSEANKV